MHSRTRSEWRLRPVWGRATLPVRERSSRRLTASKSSSVVLIAISILVAAIATVLTQTAQAQKTVAPPVKSTRPSDDTQIYRNKTFGFRAAIPYGWVDRTKEMQEGNDAAKAQVLLAVFEHPPEATADAVNSAIVIASESVTSYPGLKKAEDYLGPLTELTTAKGFKADGDAAIIEIDARELVRADFTKALNDKLIMYQSTLVLLTKSQIVSFTFIAGSSNELDDLIGGLHFGAAKSPAR